MPGAGTEYNPLKNQQTGRSVTTIISLPRAIAVLTLTVLLTVFSYFYLDTGIAMLVYRLLNSSDRLLQVATAIPDLLLHLVVAITVFSWAGYFFMIRRGIHNRHTRFLKACGTVVPVAFIVKTMLQYVFGRPDPYTWILDHELPRFHWFSPAAGYGCFPSGHMTVFTALMAVLSSHYPRYRQVYLGLLCLLALALIATDHHFLSDVLAGAALGAVTALVFDKIPDESGARENSKAGP